LILLTSKIITHLGSIEGHKALDTLELGYI